MFEITFWKYSYFVLEHFSKGIFGQRTPDRVVRFGNTLYSRAGADPPAGLPIPIPSPRSTFGRLTPRRCTRCTRFAETAFGDYARTGWSPSRRRATKGQTFMARRFRRRVNDFFLRLFVVFFFFRFRSFSFKSAFDTIPTVPPQTSPRAFRAHFAAFQAPNERYTQTL